MKKEIKINSCLCGCNTTRKGTNGELYCTACFKVVEYELVTIKKMNNKQDKAQ
tara:strand:+ start:752 stop:910 length:159 start_codon:yes stop_codon:yes gene_type:complete